MEGVGGLRASVPSPQSGAQAHGSDSQHMDLTMQHHAVLLNVVQLEVGGFSFGVTTFLNPHSALGRWRNGGNGWVKGWPCSPGAFHQDPNPNEPQASKDKAELRNYTVRGGCGAGERP